MSSSGRSALIGWPEKMQLCTFSKIYLFIYFRSFFNIPSSFFKTLSKQFIHFFFSAAIWRLASGLHGNGHPMRPKRACFTILCLSTSSQNNNNKRPEAFSFILKIKTSTYFNSPPSYFHFNPFILFENKRHKPNFSSAFHTNLYKSIKLHSK